MFRISSLHKRYRIVITSFLILFSISCNKSNTNTGDQVNSLEEYSPEVLAKLRQYKGVGPISNVSLSEEIDMNMANQGKAIFMTMCTSCHKPNEDFIGPSPVGILKRRSPEWIMNMILNPEEMNQQDSLAAAIYEQYNRSPMSNQFLSKKQAREILEYFRTL